LRILRYTATKAEEDLHASWIAEFKKDRPNITIEAEVVPFGELSNKIQASVAGGSPPDIFFIDGPNTKTYAYLKILRPLDEYLPAGFKADIVDATLEEQSYLGQLYSMPDRQTAPALFYNKDMLDAIGVKPPTKLADAWTWDEALKVWMQLKAKSPDVWPLEPSRFGAGGAGFYYRDGIISRSAGDRSAPVSSSLYKTFAAISPDGTTVQGYIDSPEAITAGKWFQDLTMVHAVTSKVGIPNAFLDKKAAMSIDHEGILGRMNTQYPNGGFNIGVTPMPYFKKPVVMTGSNASGISARSTHPAEAAAFLNYIYNDTNRLRYWEANRNMPARKSLFDKLPAYKDYPLSMLKEQLLTIGAPRPPTPAWAIFDSIINAAIKDISLGAPVETTLHKAAVDVDKELAKYPK
jgi:ABC-type glycerol-3-phosphate transport system substrate-binding protein